MAPNTTYTEAQLKEDVPPPPCYPNIVTDAIKTVFEILFSITEAAVHSVLAIFWCFPLRYKSVTNDVVLITGGGKGIGRLLAVEFAKHRPKQIILWGRHDDTLASTANVVTRMGTPCDYMICDVSDRSQIFKQAEALQEKFGDVTIVVNNAGVVFGNTILDSTPEDIEHTMNVNVMAHFWTTKAFLQSMLDKNRGHFVFMNSVLGLMGLPGAADYSTSKFAATGFSESLNLEIAKAGKHGVKVTTVHPYHVLTDMFAGCTHRFPMLIPSLDPEYVAWKVVDATLTDQTTVLIPRIMYLVNFVKSVLPTRASLALNRFFGTDRTMDYFHRRTLKKQS